MTVLCCSSGWCGSGSCVGLLVATGKIEGQEGLPVKPHAATLSADQPVGLSPVTSVGAD